MVYICKRCLRKKDPYQKCCPHCGRQSFGKGKVWHNIKDWFRIEYIGKYAKSTHRFGIFSYAIFILKLRLKKYKLI